MAAAVPFQDGVDVAGPSSFGEILRNYRLAAGLTQEELAERAGLSARAISDHERGIKQRPHPATARMLADALGLSPVARSLLTSAAGKLGSSTATSHQSQPHPSLPIGGFLGALPVGPLVARETELARVVAAIDGLERGQRPLMLLAGEPGIGKTRLAQEIALVLQEREFLVLIGRCYGTERDIPYYPFLEALGAAWAAVPDDMRTRISSDLPHLQRLLPDGSAPLPGTSGTSHEERDPLRRAVAAFLQAVAAQVPVALLLDDLHWADRSSLGLLQHLARFTHGSRIFLLGTYRDVEVGPDHPLQAAIVDLRRDQLVEVVGLAPLSPTGTRALIEATLDDVHVSDAAADLVHERTDGNPFFVQAVLRELDGCIEQEGRGGRLFIDDLEVPNTVRALILQRLSSLSPAAQNLAFRASVLGQAFGFDDLLATGEGTEDEEEGLEEAKRAGLIRVTGRDAYAFSHALTHQAVYDELPAGRRRRLHLAVGLALEDLPERTRRRRVGEIARHLLEGGNLERALVYTLLAGEAAETVFAHDQAERHYRTALTLARELSDGEKEIVTLEKLGFVLRMEMRYAEAIDVLEQAAQQCMARGDVEGEARLVAQIGWAYRGRQRVTDGLKRVQVTVERREAMGIPDTPSPGLFALYESLANLLCFTADGRYEEALAAVERAYRVAEALGDRAMLARSEGRWGVILGFLQGRQEEGTDHLQRSITLAEEVDDLDTLARALHNAGVHHFRQGRWDEARRSSQRCFEVAKRSGNTIFTVRALDALGGMANLVGNWAEAAEYWEGARAIVETTDVSTMSGIRARTPWHTFMRGETEAARQQLEGLLATAERSGDVSLLKAAQTQLAEIDLLAEEPQAAVARLEPLLAHPELEDQNRLDVIVPLVRACLSMAGDPTAARRAAELAAEAVDLAPRRQGPAGVIVALPLQALVLARNGRWEQASQMFEEAICGARAVPCPEEEARALFYRGLAEKERGWTGAAHKSFEEALAIYRRLGAQPYIERTQQALAELESG